VDSIPLADEINKKAGNLGLVQDMLIQINLAKELQKGGVYIEELSALMEHVKKLKNIRLRGLMMIPPMDEEPEANRGYER
jgi:hypothetical protein